ncbi:MAG: 4'-phosphopantetheinyl transferase superfamily protein [Synergistaceae bacterium]|nr:4'-phosphopantetheinyl transferase superfamily protein [Synergistaceae bacterium]
MKRAVEKDYFVRRVFADEEIIYAMSQGEPARHFASAFAAKEALAKASGLGMFGMGLTGAWVRRTERGPVMMMSVETKSKLSGTGADKCWLSLTHEGDYAMAFVVLESTA